MPALSIRLSSLQNTRHRSHISSWIPGEVLLPSSSSCSQNRYDLFPWALAAGTWAWLSVTSETGRIWGSPVVRDVWYDISMPYITFLSIGLGSRTDSSVTTINHSRLCRIPATVADGSRKTWHHGYTRSGWSSAPVDHRTKSGEVFGSNRIHLGTTVGRQRSNLNGHGSKPWHPGEHQNSWYIYIYVYISGCSPPKAWYYRFWLIPISTSMKWSLVTSSLSTHRLQDSTASLNGSQWYDGYELFPTFQAAAAHCNRFALCRSSWHEDRNLALYLVT